MEVGMGNAVEVTGGGMNPGGGWLTSMVCFSCSWLTLSSDRRGLLDSALVGEAVASRPLDIGDGVLVGVVEVALGVVVVLS